MDLVHLFIVLNLCFVLSRNIDVSFFLFKNVGDVSPPTMSSDATPNTSCDEDDNR